MARSTKGSTPTSRTLRTWYRELDALAAFARTGSLGFDALMVLLILSPSNARTPGGISSSLCLSRAKTTRCLKELVASGLAEETLHPNDLRKCLFRQSNKGEIVLYEILKARGRASLEGEVQHYTQLRCAAERAGELSGQRITTTTQRILLALPATSDALTVSQVCDATALPQPRISMALKKLKIDGLVEQGDATSDRRIRTYCLSEKGSGIRELMLRELKE